MFTAKPPGTPSTILRLLIAVALVVPLLVIGLSSARADHWAFCKVCHRTFLMPGGGGGAGVARITCDTCRCRTKDSAFDECCNAQQMANQIIQLFKMRCDTLNALTNDLNNRIIKMTLDFCQWELPSAQVPGGYFDYYRLQTRMTRRTIE